MGTQNGTVVWEYDYQNGITKNYPKQTQNTFNEIMKIQSRYSFLGHKERTPEEHQTIIKKVGERLKGIQTKVLTIIMFLGLGLSLTSCDKNTVDEQQLITQEFSLKTVLTQVDNMNKGWDPSLWIYEYSDIKYELKVSNAMNTYTRQVSVNEMLAGSVSFQLVPGLYTVTYNPIHQPKFDNKLDVSINMTNMTIDGTPIILQGNLSDALIILDIPGIVRVNYNYPETAFYYDARGFWYAYTNEAFSDLFLYFGASGGEKMLTISPLNLGKVYWVQSNIGVQVQLNIPLMEIETFILP